MIIIGVLIFWAGVMCGAILASILAANGREDERALLRQYEEFLKDGPPPAA